MKNFIEEILSPQQFKSASEFLEMNINGLKSNIFDKNTFYKKIKTINSNHNFTTKQNNCNENMNIDNMQKISNVIYYFVYIFFINIVMMLLGL